MDLAHPRKADRVAQDLLEQVVSGDLTVGAVIPKESELAERYGVNRGVVREAIKLLEVHQLVRPVRRRGTVVLDPLASLSPAVLRAMLVPGPGRIDREVLADLLEVRAELDVQMTGLAAERRTDQDLAAMDACLVTLREALSDGPAYARAVDDLSLALARATHNRVFEMLVHWHALVHADLGDLFAAVRRASEPHTNGLTILVDLVRRRDAETARRVVASFHEWATPRLLMAAALSTGEPLDHVLEVKR